MTDHQLDRIARLLSSAGSRRRALAALGALALARVTPASAATQIEIAACGEAGAVCTQIKGCCEGLVCATSYTNPAYGVCVTGEGDMLAVSDDVVVPGAEGIEEELAQEVTDAAADATAGATEAESILAARDTEIQARKTARDTTEASQRTRRRTNQNTQQSRKATNRTEQRTSKDAKQAARELNKRPRLLVKLSDSTVPTKPEILRVWNRDNVAVVVSRVESIKDPGVYDNQAVTIAAGDTYLFLSGENIGEDQDKSGSTVWAPNEEICSGSADGGGVRVTAAKQFATEKHRFVERCPSPTSIGTESQPVTKNRKKRGKGQ
jgi:hypothetical protein